jgi:hypothetical protein
VLWAQALLQNSEQVGISDGFPLGSLDSGVSANDRDHRGVDERLEGAVSVTAIATIVLLPAHLDSLIDAPEEPSALLLFTLLPLHTLLIVVED